MEIYEGSCHATKKVIELCSTSGSFVKHFVYVSSLSSVGPSPEGKPTCQDMLPVSDYGKSKRIAESDVLSAGCR